MPENNVATMIMAHECACDAYLCLYDAIADAIEHGVMDAATADKLVHAVQQARTILGYWL
jgi:hypothetical protein